MAKNKIFRVKINTNYKINGALMLITSNYTTTNQNTNFQGNYLVRVADSAFRKSLNPTELELIFNSNLKNTLIRQDLLSCQMSSILSQKLFKKPEIGGFFEHPLYIDFAEYCQKRVLPNARTFMEKFGFQFPNSKPAIDEHSFFILTKQDQRAYSGLMKQLLPIENCNLDQLLVTAKNLKQFVASIQPKQTFKINNLLELNDVIKQIDY